MSPVSTNRRSGDDLNETLTMIRESLASVSKQLELMNTQITNMAAQQRQADDQYGVLRTDIALAKQTIANTTAQVTTLTIELEAIKKELIAYQTKGASESGEWRGKLGLIGIAAMTVVTLLVQLLVAWASKYIH